MKNVALLMARDLAGFVVDDQLLVEAFKAAEWRAAFVSWDEPQRQWFAFSAAIIRATWDYTTKLDAFLPALKQIESEDVPLYNSAALARWNSHKSYLLDLQKRGVPVVPTQIFSRLEQVDFRAMAELFATDQFIVKPPVSANARDTYIVRMDDWHAQSWMAGEVMVQPFLPTIQSEGEFSLIFFNGRFSHGIQKVPKAGDFRVQEEHGGKISAIRPSADLLEAGQRAIAAVDENLLYARVDLVRNLQSVWQVMELELIEPSLYLRTDPGAAARFVAAFLERQ